MFALRDKFKQGMINYKPLWPGNRHQEDKGASNDLSLLWQLPPPKRILIRETESWFGFRASKRMWNPLVTKCLSWQSDNR